MPCPPCKRASSCSILVVIISTLFFITGMVCVYYTVELGSSNIWQLVQNVPNPVLTSDLANATSIVPILGMENSKLNTLKQLLYYPTLLLCISTIFLAINGYVGVYTKHFLPLGSFAIFTLLSSISFIATGSLMLSADVAANR